MRSIHHPGPPPTARAIVVPCRAEAVRLQLEPGRSVNQAVAEAFARAGVPGGYVRLRGAPVSPMRYVIPAASPDAGHAAWYSGTFAPAGVSRIEDAGLVAGRRDDQPFLHCHGIWRTPGGERRMGHLLPLETEFAEPVEAEAWTVTDAVFEAADDPETGFRLFRPAPCRKGGADGAAALLCAFRPNQDIGAAIEAACRSNGIGEAFVHGIGSLIGAEFEDGTGMSSYATEVLLRQGRVAAGRATLDISMVGMEGELAEGRLARGVNPVCVTFEILIVAA
jgi:predicted DNA-binding protein with PD1-like motif